MVERIRGYAEGYYGRLLSWNDRIFLLDVLARNKQNTYYYAPKEDALHRLQWRTPYDAQWLSSFSTFTAEARSRNIKVVAGVAPGLDFDFQHLPAGPDFKALLQKCRCLLNAGADHVSLLLDDIDEDFASRSGSYKSEGLAHASLAMALSESLGEALWLTPRIYANELVESAPDYLPHFLDGLDDEHTVLYCGSDVVAYNASVEPIRDVVTSCSNKLVLWDNLYAHDYCPRRLFVGPWTGRENNEHILLNPTGMPNTDELLLSLMADRTSVSEPQGDNHVRWETILRSHGVPDAFFAIANYFYHPVCNGVDSASPTLPVNRTLDAIEECLWRWKSPLSREWYPFIFGLKHDILIAEDALPELRIQKTQNQPLSQRLIGLKPN